MAARVRGWVMVREVGSCREAAFCVEAGTVMHAMEHDVERSLCNRVHMVKNGVHCRERCNARAHAQAGRACACCNLESVAGHVHGHARVGVPRVFSPAAGVLMAWGHAECEVSARLVYAGVVSRYSVPFTPCRGRHLTRAVSARAR